MGSSGDYSDRIDYPISLYLTENLAEEAVKNATSFSKERNEFYKKWHDNIYSPWYNKTKPLFGPDAPIYPDEPKQPKYPPNPYDPEHYVNQNAVMVIIYLLFQIRSLKS